MEMPTSRVHQSIDNLLLDSFFQVVDFGKQKNLDDLISHDNLSMGPDVPQKRCEHQFQIGRMVITQFVVLVERVQLQRLEVREKEPHLFYQHFCAHKVMEHKLVAVAFPIHDLVAIWPKTPVFKSRHQKFAKFPHACHYALWVEPVCGFQVQTFNNLGRSANFCFRNQSHLIWRT
jgi:hypothetical protein